MHDSLGDRMKGYYETRTRFYLPRRTNTIIRLDGKAFHTYTRGLQKPFDVAFIGDMCCTMFHLCKEIQGAKIGYTQSDEISILLTDYGTITTDAWFDGNIQKICSVSSSIATQKFNELRPDRPALFDSRVFTIPDLSEVTNYFLWRTKDAERNSLQSLAQSLYSQKELHGKGTVQLHEMCFAKGRNWNDLYNWEKNGTVTQRVNAKWVTNHCTTFDTWNTIIKEVVNSNE